MRKPGNRKALAWGFGVGFLSSAALGLEITLSNVFGVLLQYHYVSLIISLALFGIGAGSYAARSYRGSGAGALRAAGWVCTAAAIYIALLSFFLARFPYVDQLALYAFLGAVPFGLFGWVMGVALRSGALPVRTIYAADLLGAGIGVAGAYGCLHLFGGLKALFAMALFALLGALGLFVFGGSFGKGHVPERRRPAGISLTALLLAVVIAGLGFGSSANLWNLDLSALKGAAPDKTLVASLQTPGAVIERTAWDEFARTDVVSTPDANRKMVFVDGGAGSYMYRFDGNLQSVAGLARDIEFLPFAIGPATNSIVVGSGGGRDILYTLMAGAKRVTAVELSEGIVRSMREDAAYNGGILDRPGVTTIVGDGRSVLENSRERYDLIVLDLVYSQVGGLNGQALSENYVFTREAFKTYWNRLADGGRIVVISHQGLEGIRAYYTGMDAIMAETGQKPGEVAGHTALIRAPEGSASPNLTLTVLQNTTLTNEQLGVLQAGVKSLGLQALFLPKSNEIFLKPLLDGKVPFDAFVRDSDYTVYPTTDNRPFFFQLTPDLPGSLWTWLALIGGLTILFFLYVGWNEYAPSRRRAAIPDRLSIRFRSLAYFVLIGIGYMGLQAALIQKSMVYAGNPALAASVVIFAMLIGGSAGSRWAGSRRFLSVRVALPLVVVVAGLLAVADYVWGDGLFRVPLAERMILIGLAIGILGFAAGIPMPSRLEEEERRQTGISPFLFAVNGIAGIWGSWIGAVISLKAGLNATLAAGCMCYILLALMLWLKRKERGNEQQEPKRTVV